MKEKKDIDILEESAEHKEEVKNRYKYDTITVKALIRLVEKGPMSVAKMCDVVGITERLFYLWRKEISEFREALTKAKKRQIERRLELAEESLVSLIEGSTYTEVTKEMLDGKLEITKEVTKVREPSLAAIKHYQTNKSPMEWKERQTIDNQHSGDIKASFTIEVVPSGVALSNSESDVDVPFEMREESE